MEAPPAALARPTLTVHTDAVRANVRRIAARSGAAVMAVVKADGFGHGAADVARAALAAGATWLGTATLAEAVAVRRAGFAAPMLTWLLPPGADRDAALRLRIDLAVASLADLDAVIDAARRTGLRARIHLHADTGMAREGAAPEEWRPLVAAAARAEASGRVDAVGVMGHLPCADDPGHRSVGAGLRAFDRAAADATAAGLTPSLRHLAATEAALRIPAATHDLVRIGAGLVGVGPGLQPASTLTAPVVRTRTVPAGTPVGYGHSHVTAVSTVLALLPIGYGDGIPRRIDADASVLLGGRRCAIVGRVSMDQLVVDAGTADVRAGDDAIVFGPGALGEPTVAEWAAWAGTIGHEIVTGIGPRVERVAAVGGDER